MKQVPLTLRRNLYDLQWVVYAKTPFGGPDQVIEYLGRYTHKVAISNHRLIGLDENTVTFRYKDYRDGSKSKVMRLAGDEFLRRFALHLLPAGFHRMRHYGFLANRNKARLKALQLQRGTVPKKREKIHWKTICKTQLNFDPDVCPKCKSGFMKTIQVLAARSTSTIFHCCKCYIHPILKNDIARKGITMSPCNENYIKSDSQSPALQPLNEISIPKYVKEQNTPSLSHSTSPNMPR